MRLIVCLFLVCIIHVARAAENMSDTYFVVNAGSGDSWYHGSSGAGTAWEGLDLGTITTLTIKGGEIKGCESIGSNISAANIYYRVYKQGCSPGSWSSAIDIEFNHDYSGSYCGAGDEVKVNKSDYSIDVLPSSDGEYYFEVIWQFQDNSGQKWDAGPAEGCGNDCHMFTGVVGRKASFTVGSGGGDGAVTAEATTFNWSSDGDWVGDAGPVTGDLVTIPNGATVTLNEDAEIGAIKIENGGSLIFESSQGRTLTINGEGCGDYLLEFVSGGTFTRNDGKVVFEDDGEVGGSGTVDFNDVTIQGGIDFNSHDIHGTLEILSGGYVSDAPTYETGSTVYYNNGAAYGRNTEWSATSGDGYPYNVHVGSGVTLDLGNGGSGTARQIAGDLTLDGTLTMNATAMTASLTVKGDITINATGALTLSGSGGGDMVVEGDFTNNGTFTCNTRKVEFAGSDTQTLTGDFTGVEGIDYFNINNSHGSNGVSLASDVEIDFEVRFDDGFLILNGNDLIFDSDAINSATLTPSSASHIVTNGTGVVTKQSIGVADDFTYAIGPAAGSYNPVIFESAAVGYTIDNISARVESGLPTVADGYDQEAEITNTSDYVNVTWIMEEGAPGGMAGDFTFQWAGSDEGGSFTRANGDVFHYNGSGYDNLSENTRGGSDPYTQRAGVPVTLSPFIVGDIDPTVLPVELIAFDAKFEGENVLVDWSTAGEINNDYFIIERSNNGVDFESIGRVAGAGTVSHASEYYLVDELPLNQAYYRLVQVDFDGTATTYPAVYVSLEKQRNQVSLAGRMLRYTGKEEPSSVTLYDLSGKSVWTEKWSSNVVQLPQHISQGVYQAVILFDQSDRQEIREVVVIR